MNIIVLAGGISTERDVSIVTGTMVCKALRSKGHNAVLVDVYFGIEDIDHIFTIDYDVDHAASKMKDNNEILDQIKSNRDNYFGTNVLELCKAADIVFMGLHGEDGENGKIQAAFDLMGIKYTGSGYIGSALAMDKGLSKKLFIGSGIPTPVSINIKKADYDINENVCGITFPCVVKPCSGGSSIGVYIAHNQKEYENALKEAFLIEEELLVETYIKGREFSVGVVGGVAYPIIEIVPKSGFYDYTNKYVSGMTDEYCPADIPEELTREMQDYAIKVCEQLKLEAYARVDFMLNENNQMYCLEANTLPGMTSTSLIPQEAAAIGIDYTTLCERLIEVSLEKYI